MPYGEGAGSKTKVRSATTEDVEVIHDLACELAETVGDSPPVSRKSGRGS